MKIIKLLFVLLLVQSVSPNITIESFTNATCNMCQLKHNTVTLCIYTCNRLWCYISRNSLVAPTGISSKHAFFFRETRLNRARATDSNSSNYYYAVGLCDRYATCVTADANSREMLGKKGRAAWNGVRCSATDVYVADDTTTMTTTTIYICELT